MPSGSWFYSACAVSFRISKGRVGTFSRRSRINHPWGMAYYGGGGVARSGGSCSVCFSFRLQLCGLNGDCTLRGIWSAECVDICANIL